MPSTTSTANLSTIPSSGAAAVPEFRSMHQLCSGHATLSPNTIPWESGPPLWGQWSCSAKTLSAALRKMAMVLPSACR